MFPEITRDEVFRIETPRLWLRWPVPADADALVAIMGEGFVADGARIARVNADAIRSLIAAWRGEMEAGGALHLVMTAKAGERQPKGIIHARAGAAVSCRTADEQARSLGAEADRALRDMMRLLGVKAQASTPPMAHQRRPVGMPEPVGCCLQA